MPPPKRKGFNHVVPGWVRGGPIFFVTLCALHRGKNQFCHPKTAQALFDSAQYYHEQTRWHVHLLLLMPDHLHALISFPKVESMQRVIRSWKHYLAKQYHIEWQRDFFEHRLRSDESHEEKADYIRQNPVRASLIASADLWPYVWEPDQ